MFPRIARRCSSAVGHPIAFIAGTATILAWIYSDRPFDWLDAISAATLWLLFLLQSSQNADTVAIQTKLDEILRAIPEANDQLRGIEQKD